MAKPSGTPPAEPEFVQLLTPEGERVEHPDNLIPAYRRAIRATEEGQAALLEVMIKPMRTPELPSTITMC